MLKRDLYYERIPTKSLRDDVRFLGNILGRVIKEQEGQKFYDLVEKIRLLSKANIANKNRKDPFKKILNEIKKFKYSGSLFKIQTNAIGINQKKFVIKNVKKRPLL